MGGSHQVGRERATSQRHVDTVADAIAPPISLLMRARRGAVLPWDVNTS